MSKKTATSVASRGTSNVSRDTTADVSKTLPVARFYYQGSHSHPVRRTVLVIETTNNIIRGYEMREGATIRSFKDALVKSYRKDMIAAGEELRQKSKEKTTLKRLPLFDLIENGV